MAKKKIIGLVFGSCLYVLSPLIAGSVWYRVYYEPGRIWVIEHWVVVSLQLILTFLSWSNHYQASSTDPGIVKQSDFRHQNWSYYEEDKLNEKMREKSSEKICPYPLCKKCGAVKFANIQMGLFTHHCSTCEHCILAMDHHCAYTQSCIGFYNAKPFFLFLIFQSVQCASGAFLVLRETIRRGNTDFVPLSPVHGLLRAQSYPFKWVMAEFLGFDRKTLGLYEKVDGQIVYPQSHERFVECLIDNFCYLGNLGFLVFTLSMILSFLNNLKHKVTHPIILKLKGQTPRWPGRTWKQVFTYIFSPKNEINTLVKFSSNKPEIEKKQD